MGMEGKKKSLKPIETAKGSNQQAVINNEQRLTEPAAPQSAPINQGKSTEKLAPSAPTVAVDAPQGPLPQPEKADKAASLTKKSLSLSGMGISLSSLANVQTSDNIVSEPEAEQLEANLFTEAELLGVWSEYCQRLKKEKLLKNTMSLYLPKMVSDVVFEVEVNSEINKQYLTDNSNAILTYLREKLQNGDITMTIKIAEGNAIKKALTSREIFDEMAQKNPSLQKLSDEFGLELS